MSSVFNKSTEEIFVALTLSFQQLIKYLDETLNETLLTATKCCIGKIDFRYLLKINIPNFEMLNSNKHLITSMISLNLDEDA